MKKIIITSIVLFITLTVNAQSWYNNKKIKGNGNIVTKIRTVADFDGVASGVSFNVVLVKGTEGKITIEGEENIMPYIITEIKRGTLKIEYKKNTNIKLTKKMTITIPFKDIDHVSLGGSGNIKTDDVIKAEDVRFSLGGSGNIFAKVNSKNTNTAIGGSGNIKLSGKTTSFKCSIAGSGSIKAYGLTTDNLKATIAGSGSIKTTVNKKIKATVVGSGSIYYKGNATHIDSKALGSGDVIDKN